MAMTLRRPKLATATKTTSLSRSELRAVFEKNTRERLEMSGDEFLKRLDEGTLPDDPAVDEIAILVGED